MWSWPAPSAYLRGRGGLTLAAAWQCRGVPQSSVCPSDLRLEAIRAAPLARGVRSVYRAAMPCLSAWRAQYRGAADPGVGRASIHGKEGARMPQTAVECVLVVPASLLARLGHFQGFTADVDRYLGELFHPRHTSYRPRCEMECDPAYKQLIPYCVFRYRGADGRVWVFAYTRGSGQGEERLRCKRSIGVGGHISLLDAQTAGVAAYEEGMRRELEEEVKIGAAYTQRCVGLINDDLTEVGRVHLGVVHLFDLERPAVEPREADLVDAAFVSLEELAAERARLESWSQICLDHLLRPGLA